MFEILQLVSYSVVVMGLIGSLYIAKSFGKGILNVPFFSLCFSLFFIGAYFVFSVINDFGQKNLSNVTFHVWSHVIVYLAFISLIWGGFRIKSMVRSGKESGFGFVDIVFFSVLIVITFGVFFLSPKIELSMAPFFEGSFVDKFGLHHLSVFILGIIAIWYLLFIKGQWGLFGTSMKFMIAFLLLIGGQHLWEVLTENLKVVVLEDILIEIIEFFFILPGLLMVLLSEWVIIKFVKGKS